LSSSIPTTTSTITSSSSSSSSSAPSLIASRLVHLSARKKNEEWIKKKKIFWIKENESQLSYIKSLSVLWLFSFCKKDEHKEVEAGE